VIAEGKANITFDLAQPGVAEFRRAVERAGLAIELNLGIC